jgi:SprT-like protein
MLVPLMMQTHLTDDTWTTAATENDADDASNMDHPQTKLALRERAACHAAAVAAEHFPELPVEAITWETSTRMERSAGKAIYDPAGEDEEITIRLSWDAYQEYGWEQFARVVRHELIHAWQYHEHGDGDHGPTFRQWIEPLETDRHCERYAEPTYWVVCEACSGRSTDRTPRSPRHRPAP